MLEESSRGRWLAVVLLIAVLVPYAPMLVGTALPFSDDIGASDLLDGEFPGRVEAARTWRSGQGAVWTPGVLGGAPIVVDPLSLGLFAVLPPGLALGWTIGVALAIAALGTFVLARHYGSYPAAAALAGFAFAWSGFFVCQLRHLSVLGTVASFPLALYCLERLAAPVGGSARDGSSGRSEVSNAPSESGDGGDVGDARDVGASGDSLASIERSPSRRPAVWLARAPWLVAFALVFGFQLSFAFPQSAYACGLVYGVVGLVRLIQLQVQFQRQLRAAGRRRDGASAERGALRLSPDAIAFVITSVVAVALGIGLGSISLLPLGELAATSDRAGAGTFEWATRQNYWPRNALTFLLPYVNGDITDFSYAGRNLFWEDYAYVGWTTIVLAVLAAVFAITGRTVGAGSSAPSVRHVGLWLGIGVVAYLIVLGKHTPVYGWAFEFLPGMARFRLPQRFLFVVELALVLTAAQGLTALQDLLRDRLETRRPALVAAIVAWGITAWTAIDLVATNARQNAWVDTRTWLATPRTAEVIKASGVEGRVYTPGDRRLREQLAYATKGWAGDLGPYVAFREHLQPNSNLLHGVAAIDGYTGLAPRWSVDLVGDHNRAGLLMLLFRYEQGTYAVHPAAFDVLEAVGVRWLSLHTRLNDPRIEQVAKVGDVTLHRLRDTLPRARLVARGRHLERSEDAILAILEGRLDLRREVVVHEAEHAASASRLLRPATAPVEAKGDAVKGAATIRRDEATLVELDVETSRECFLLLADTYHPGWSATLDGQPVDVLRVNLAHRAVVVPAGRHRLVFRFRSPAVERGMIVSSISLAILALIGVVGLAASRRSRRGEGGA